MVSLNLSGMDKWGTLVRDGNEITCFGIKK